MSIFLTPMTHPCPSDDPPMTYRSAAPEGCLRWPQLPHRSPKSGGAVGDLIGN